MAMGASTDAATAKDGEDDEVAAVTEKARASAVAHADGVEVSATTTTTTTMDDGASHTDAVTMVPLRLRLNHTQCNVPSLAHLSTTYEVMVKSDGSDTAGDVKRALEKSCNVPAHMLRLVWFDATIGREHEGQERELDERDTLEKHNVVRWITQFPHWCATLMLLNTPPRDALESIHTAVAMHKGVKDIKQYVEDKRKTPEWHVLQE